jgi:hypothetical protein
MSDPLDRTSVESVARMLEALEAMYAAKRARRLFAAAGR